jgi:ribonuclease HIII
MKKTITKVIRVDNATKKLMDDFYKDMKRDKTPPYAIFQADTGDTIVTLYESGKAMFQGVSADIEADMWENIGKNKEDLEYFIDTEEKEEREEEIPIPMDISSIGSDEVGTGDYFGPIVVTACYVKKDQLEKLEKLGIGDSKKIDDEKIKKIAPQIAKEIKYKSVILTNKEYNEKYNKDINMNKIKAILHNKVLYQLVNEEKVKYDYIIVDEFAREARYYEYIHDQKAIQRDITFLTKAEDISPAVGCASIISRYLFLKEFDKICDSIHIPLPKGAGKDVDTIGEEVVEKYGEEKLKEIAKMNFRNTERILHTMIY